MKGNTRLIKMALLASSASAFVPGGSHCSFRCSRSNSNNSNNNIANREGCDNRNKQNGRQESVLWMELDFDRMYASELEKLARQMGYDPTGKDRVDLITICKGDGNMIGAKRIRSNDDSTPNSASSAANSYYNGIHLVKKSKNRAAAAAEKDPASGQQNPSKLLDPDIFDRMYTSELETMAQDMGFDIARHDRVNLIMICKGYGDVIGARRLPANSNNNNQNNNSASSPMNNSPNCIHLSRTTKSPNTNANANANANTNANTNNPPMSTTAETNIRNALSSNQPFGTFGIATRNASSPANDFPNGIHLVPNKQKSKIIPNNVAPSTPPPQEQPLPPPSSITEDFTDTSSSSPSPQALPQVPTLPLVTPPQSISP